MPALHRPSPLLTRCDTAGWRAAEMFPDIARAQAMYGWALALSGDTKGAADQFALALQADPNDTRTLEYSRRLPT